MTRRQEANGRGERGIVVVEFALVAPLVLGLIFGLLEVGISVIGSAVGSNAAREGARVGVVDYVDADDPSSATFQAIDDAVRSRLAGMVQEGSNLVVDVRCLDYDEVRDDASDPSIPCTTDDVEEGRDLLEVSVTWKPIVLTGVVGSGSRTSTARMAIISHPTTSGGSGSGSGAGLSIHCSPSAITETDTNQTVTCTITRSHTTDAVTVLYATSDGTATEPSDYTAANGTAVFAANGSTTYSFTVNVTGDTVYEDTEVFTVTLSGPVNAYLSSPTVETISIANDDSLDVTPPTLLHVRLYDSATPLAKVDTIVLTFDEAMGPACVGNQLVVNNRPAGYSQTGVSVSGNTVTISLGAGSGYVTSVSGMTVSYTSNPTGLCDAAGNAVASLTVASSSIQDWAAPYLVGITGTNSGTALQPSSGDTIRYQFTEPMNVPAAGTLTLSRSNGSNKVTNLTVGALAQLVSLGNVTNWFGGNNGGTATFALNYSVSGNAVVATLGSCSGSCSFSNGAASVSIPAFSWGTTPTDTARANAAGAPAGITTFPVTVFLF